MGEKDRQIVELESKIEALEVLLAGKGVDEKDLQVARFKSKIDALEALLADKDDRKRETVLRLVVAALLTLASGIFFWCLSDRLLNAHGVAAEARVPPARLLAAVLGVAALWTISLVVFLRGLGTRR